MQWWVKGSKTHIYSPNFQVLWQVFLFLKKYEEKRKKIKHLFQPNQFDVFSAVNKRFLLLWTCIKRLNGSNVQELNSNSMIGKCGNIQIMWNHTYGYYANVREQEKNIKNYRITTKNSSSICIFILIPNGEYYFCQKLSEINRYFDCVVLVLL
jgi:hypothetical protein